jgi:hypothetical protein
MLSAETTNQGGNYLLDTKDTGAERDRPEAGLLQERDFKRDEAAFGTDGGQGRK